MIQTIDKKSSILDKALYEGSVTSDGDVVNPYRNMQRVKESQQDRFHKNVQHGIAEHQEHNPARYRESRTNIAKAQTVSRPSVIRSLNNPRAQEETFLQIESD